MANLVFLKGLSTISTMVHERDDKDKTKFVDYDRFGLIVIKAIQELMKKINIKKAD